MSGGTTRRRACGSTTYRIDWARDSARASAERDLRRVDRVDAGTDHLGDVGAVGQHQRERGQPEQAVGESLQLQGRDAEGAEDDHQQGGDAAEQVGVGDGQHPQRHQPGRDRVPGDRHQDADHQDDRLGDQEHPHVEPEPVPDRGERRLRVVPAEERVLYPGPAGRRGDPDAEQAERDDGDRGRGEPALPPDPAGDALAFELPGARRPVAHFSTGTSTTSESQVCSSCSRVPSDSSLPSASSTQGQQLAALLHQQAELLGRTGRVELPRDRALRDLDGRDDEGVGRSATIASTWPLSTPAWRCWCSGTPAAPWSARRPRGSR